MEFMLDLEEDRALNLQNHDWRGWGAGDILREGNSTKSGRWQIVKHRTSILPKILLLIFFSEKSIFQRRPPTPTCLGSSKLVIGIPNYIMPKRIHNIPEIPFPVPIIHHHQPHASQTLSLPLLSISTTAASVQGL